MRKFALVSASLALALAGCSCGQGWRPNIFSNLYNRIHGVSNVGAPCDAGCAAPMSAPISVPTSGCATCGDGVISNYGDAGSEIIGSYPSSYELGTPTSYVSPGPTSYVSQPPVTYAPVQEPIRAAPNR